MFKKHHINSYAFYLIISSHISFHLVTKYLSRSSWSYHNIRHQQADSQLQKDVEDNYIAVVPSEIPPLPTWKSNDQGGDLWMREVLDMNNA